MCILKFTLDNNILLRDTYVYVIIIIITNDLQRNNTDMYHDTSGSKDHI